MSNKTRVFVTGLGVICPVGNTIEEMWTNIRNGVSGITKITRFDPARIDAKIAGEVKNFKATDHIEFKEAKRMALFTQYAVVAAKQAWKDAGFEANPPADPTRVAVMVGNGIGGKEIDDEAYHTLYTKGPSRFSPLIIPKLISNEAAGNISIILHAQGASHTIVTACASSTDSLGTALDMIRDGRADVVIAGGTEATITEYCIGGFCAMKALSTKRNDEPTKACRPFDAERDGFIMGEGAAMLILESEAHAKARGAHAYVELAGYGASSDAFHLTAPDPTAGGAMRAIRLALEDAGLKTEDVDYLSAHGTSTSLNDSMETTAVKGVFGELARTKLKISSTKSMTGHLLGAAGALEAVICTLAIRDGFYPPTINYEHPDSACDLDYVPNKGIAAPMKVAISTSLGFGGHNGCLAFKALS